MNSAELRNKIDGLRPHYSDRYRAMIEAISHKGERTGIGNIAQFGAFYQSFMYACIIGIRLGKPTYLEPKEASLEFAEMSKWKPMPIRDFVIMAMLNRTESFDYTWMQLENASEEMVNAFLRALQREMEGYANTGFAYLQQKWDTERVMFSNPTVFVDILKDLNQ